MTKPLQAANSIQESNFDPEKFLESQKELLEEAKDLRTELRSQLSDSEELREEEQKRLAEQELESEQAEEKFVAQASEIIAHTAPPRNLSDQASAVLLAELANSEDPKQRELAAELRSRLNDYRKELS